mmetsp:Transcript_2650/g.7035  ORF Transcript_2650/g.7035 Transcript_2650/m.7035 type:complete len:96 (-) Transcript_2650:371-658(-)
MVSKGAAFENLFAPSSILGENLDKLVDFILLLLKNALCDPHQVTDLLLLQFDVCIEAAKVELVFEGQLQLLHITLVKGIINRFVTSSVGVNRPDG